MADKRVTFIIGANIANFSKNLNSAQKQFSKFGKSMTSAGKTLSTRVTAPLTLAAGASIKMAADFEQSMSKIEGLVGIAGDKVTAMKADVLGLAGETARAPQELADALFFVTSAGLRGQAALDTLKASAMAAAAGLGETKDVADLVTSAVNAYGLENLNAAQATDILVAAVREGKAEAPELAQSMGQVLPIASSLGVGFDQIGAAVASMTRTGTDAATASIQLRQILASLLQPSKQAEDAMNEMGTSSAELRKQLREKGLISVLGFLREQMKTNEQAMAQVFPNIRALSGALDIMGSNASENIGIFQRMTNTTGSLDKAFESASKTASFKFGQSMASLKTASIELGNLLIPVFVDLIKYVRMAVQWFTGLDKSTKTLIVVIGGLAAALGPVLIILGGIATTIGAISAPVLAVVAAITALGLAILYIADNWDAIKARISDWSWWKNVLIDMAVFVIKYNPIALLLEPLEWVLKKLGIELPNAFDMVADKLIEMKDKPSEVYPEFGNFFDSVIGGAKKAAKSLLGIGESLGVGGGIESDTGGGNSASNIAPRITGLNQAPSIFADIGSALDVVLPKMDLLSISFAAMQSDIDKATEKKEKWAEVINGVLTNAFDGLGNAIISGMESGQNALQSFLGYFVDFAKGLLAKIISLIVAATVLSLILSTLGFGIGSGGGIKALGDGFKIGNSIGNILKGGFGMENGGVVPSGFPNDSYPAMLTSGEMVLPKPTPLPSMGGNERLVTRLEGDDLLLIVERAQDKRNNSL